MTPLDTLPRPARPNDAETLARLYNHAGEGLPLYLWERMAEPGQTAWDVGRSRAMREEGAFSYRNALMLDVDGVPAACLFGYDIPKDPNQPDADTPPIFVPLIELEALAPDSWYINVLATMPAYRGRGLGSSLIRYAEGIARTRGRPTVSLIAADGNAAAIKLYARHGFLTVATRPMVKDDWSNPSTAWILMTKPVHPD